MVGCKKTQALKLSREKRAYWIKAMAGVRVFRWVFTSNFRVCLKLDGSFHEFSSLRRENPFRITINKWDDGKCQTSTAATAENRWNTPNLRKNDALASAPAHFHYKHTISIPFFAFFSTYKQSTFLLHTPYNKITRVQQFFWPPQIYLLLYNFT